MVDLKNSFTKMVVTEYFYNVNLVEKITFNTILKLSYT